MKMQRICIDLTRLYSQSAKCAYSSVPLTSSGKNTLGTSIGFIDSIGLSKIKCSVKNIRCIASNTMPSLNNIKNWYTVKFIKTNGEVIEAKGKEGDNLLDIVTNNNLEIDGFGACEGTLACSTCHLILKQEDYDKIENPVADEELDMLDLATGLTDTSRLGCQVCLNKDLDGLEVRLPECRSDARST